MRKLLTAAVAALAALAATGAHAQKDKVKVGFVYVGPIGDHGWSYQHNQGRLAVEKALGNKVQTSFVENVSEGPDAERVIRQLAQSGHDLIFTTSFGFMNPTARVAERFPNVKFEHATGYERRPNLATYAARFYEGRYIAGRIAGKMSKTGTVGYVASFPIPEVVSGINAFMLGMQSVRPDAKIRIVWVNSWYDPGKEADAAKVLIDQGADIISQHTDSPAPLQIAEQRSTPDKPIYAFGQASDMESFAPKAQLTAIVDDWSDYYIQRTKAVLDGTWTSGDVWGDFASGMVKMSPYKNMPEDVRKLAQETEAAIRDGKLHPFRGPIYKQDGSLAVKEGEALADKDILGMNWYVKGRDDKPPQ